MPRYFEFFPTTKHSNQILVDITKRAKLLQSIGNNPNVFLPYTIKDGETAEEISYLYYGTVDYVWMIWLANTALDPYKDWPLQYRELWAYVADKYKDEYMKSQGLDTYTDQEVVDWTQDTTVDDNILYYINDDGETKISAESYANPLDPLFEASEWTAVRIWEAEDEANENKRIIQVINNIYAEQVATEFKRLMKR